MEEKKITYIDTASVRRTSGIGISEINDADVTLIIAEVEPQIERYYNTVFTPKERIETRDGNETKRLILRKNPVLNVRDLYIDGDQEDTANLHVYRGSGKIELNSDATISTFKKGTKRNVVKYTFGFLEESSTNTTTNTASTAGTSVVLSVVSETDFSTNNWVDVYGMDGYHEAAKITGTASGEITVDQLVYTHESGSTVVKLQVMEVFKKIMNICCSLAMVARIVGQSYTDIVGYNLTEFHVQKGEPYTQWRETAAQLIKERDMLMSKIKQRPVVL